MPRVCSICTHLARSAIDNDLETGQSLRDIAAHYGFSKSVVDRHKASHLPAHLAQDGADLKAAFQATRQADRWHYMQLRKNARAAMRAFEGWGSIRSPEEWQTACEDASKRYQSGRFLIERLEARITRLESDLHQIYRSLGQHDAKIEILEKHGDHE